MAEANNPNDGTFDLPAGFCEALAQYGEWLRLGPMPLARQLALAIYPQFESHWRQQFVTDDQVIDGAARPSGSDASLGAGKPPASNRYEMRTRLGKGGQGEVWLVRDAELDRAVALKHMKESAADSPEATKQFWHEAEITIQLAHPNIMPVYDAGRPADGDDSIPYYVMPAYCNRHLLRAITKIHARPRQQDDWLLSRALKEFHDDRSAENERFLEEVLARFQFDNTQECDRELREAIEALRKDRSNQSGRMLSRAIGDYHAAGRPAAELRELLTRFIDICNAIAYAHSRGVIHRDLKPANIMLGEFGETLVADWGIAKVIGREEAYKADSSGTVRFSSEPFLRNPDETLRWVKGSPQYMSPEQARGHSLSSLTDVYGLGGILYCILTGRPLRSEGTDRELVAQAAKNQYLPPSDVVPDVSEPLAAVCLKAIATEPEMRYATARELGAEITRWLGDEPVLAWKEPIPTRVLRLAKDHAGISGLLAGSVLVVFLAMALLLWMQNENSRTQSRIQERLQATNDKLFTALLDAGDLSYTSGEFARARAFFETAKTIADERLRVHPEDSDTLRFQADILTRLGHIRLAESVPELALPGTIDMAGVESAIGYYQRALDIRRNLEDKGEDEGQYEGENLKGQYLAFSQLSIAFGHAGDEAASKAYASDADSVMYEMIRKGHLEKLASGAYQIVAWRGSSPLQLVAAARAFSRCIEATDSFAINNDLKEVWVRYALLALNKAITNDVSEDPLTLDPHDLLEHRDFESIRNELRFLTHISELCLRTGDTTLIVESLSVFVEANRVAELQFAEDLTVIAEVLRECDQFELAITYLRESWEIRCAQMPDKWQTPFTQWQLGTTIMEQLSRQGSEDEGSDRISEAKQALDESFLVLKQNPRDIPAPFQDKIDRDILNLIDRFRSQGEHDEAARWEAESQTWRQAPVADAPA